jgi:succinyl-diaminopimelate desuccinylase
VIIGGGDDRLAQQPNEYVEIDPFLRSIDLYKSVVIKYLGAC